MHKDYTSIMKDEDKIKLEEGGMGFSKIPERLRKVFMKKGD